MISDCHLLLTSGMGESPKRVLNERGIQTLIVNGLIDEVLHAVKHNLNMGHLIKREPSSLHSLVLVQGRSTRPDPGSPLQYPGSSYQLSDFFAFA
ncbi:MAG: hypothetical protein ABIJ59_17960 [Pseudomonadota bacterium]